MSPGLPELPPLVCALRAAHAGSRVVETHISWVLLTGEHAYKIKKPVDFGFLDFSTLALRRRYCREELRLNRRLAADLYLAVCAITGAPGAPVFDGAGPVLEYAVKLRQFDESALADRLLARGALLPRHVDGLARDLAVFHAAAARAGAADGHGLPAAVLAAAEHNFEHLLPLQDAAQDKNARLESLLAWTRAEFQRLRPLFEARKASGWVRECHGDLHCGNLVLINGRLVAFDCIEFNAGLRWIDCLSELAFLSMDLAVRGRADLGWRLLNRYLETTGDYAGLALLDFYRVYRAMVRAKVLGLSLAQTADAARRADYQAGCLRYLDYAARAASRRAPVLLITRGCSGSGKSRLACALAERLPAVRVASDIERKRLAGLDALARSDAASAPSGGIYTEDMGRQTYALLLRHAEGLLRAGHSAVLDATYLRRAQREPCLALAGRLGARFFILDLQAPEALLRERVAQRLAQGGDPSEAGQAVLSRQLAQAEGWAAAEKPFVLALDAAAGPDLEALLRAVGAASALSGV